MTGKKLQNITQTTNEKKLSAPPTVIEAMVICESVLCALSQNYKNCVGAVMTAWELDQRKNGETVHVRFSNL